MTWTVYNKGLFEIGNLDVDAQDLRGLIIAGASIPAGLTDTSSYDLNFVSNVLAVSGVTEAAASGYVRKTLAGETLTEDDTNNYAELTWTNPVWTAVATGETWRAFVLFRFVTNDADSPVWGIDVFSAGVPTNGSDITYAGGALRITRP
jgi:hypothetical protein